MADDVVSRTSRDGVSFGCSATLERKAKARGEMLASEGVLYLLS